MLFNLSSATFALNYRLSLFVFVQNRASHQETITLSMINNCLKSFIKVKTADKTKKYSYMAIARHFWGTKVEFIVKVLYFISLWGLMQLL